MASAKPKFPSYSAALRIGILHGPERFLQDVITQNIREGLEKDRGEVRRATLESST